MKSVVGIYVTSLYVWQFSNRLPDRPESVNTVAARQRYLSDTRGHEH